MTFFVIAAVAVGTIIGVGSMVLARRSAQTHEQSIRRQRIVQRCVLVMLAAILIFDAIDNEKHRYLNSAVVALMFGGVIFDWLRGRGRRPMP